MRRLLFLLVSVWLMLLCSQAFAAGVAIDLGQSVVALNGPWRFATGDDRSRSAPEFDDSKWESVDLTPKPGAHDGDVGLKNYVPGWAAHGHDGYAGFAWYRIRVNVAGSSDRTLWLVGPASVDNAYQLFVNGHLLGSIGDLSRAPPMIVSIQPRLFAVPRDWWQKDGDRLSAVIAVRVLSLKALSGGDGGIHIAPLLGNEKGARDHYSLEWLQTVAGYTVDAVEPVFFLMLAIMALSLIPFDRKDTFYPWLAATLILLAAARGNQPLYFLAQVETIREFVLWRLVVIDALMLGAWTLAWAACFGVIARWLELATAILTAAYMIARLLGTSVLIPSLPPGVIAIFHAVLPFVRYAFAALSAFIFVRGVLRRGPADWLALLAMLLGAIGVFASELSQLGVPGIWFPYGVGVSRTEYACVAFDVVLFAYLLTRLWRYAPESRFADRPQTIGG